MQLSRRVYYCRERNYYDRAAEGARVAASARENLGMQIGLAAIESRAVREFLASVLKD